MTSNFKPSVLQQKFFDWTQRGRGSAVLIAVAGSGKSTTIVQCLPGIPEGLSVQVLAFNSSIAADMRSKIEVLGAKIGRAFRSVRSNTFHSLGNSALRYRLKLPHDHKADGRKLGRLFGNMHDKEIVDMYGSYVPKLVSLAKGQGIGALVLDNEQAWWDIVRHHDLQLEDEYATEEKAIALARGLLAASTRVAAVDKWIDFDDQLYLPVLWRLRLWANDWLFIDEAQDTNPIRRALAKMALKPGGRLVAVGDPNQAIYGFTGASHDAIDLIEKEFNGIRLPLTVSYRCPQAVGPMVRELVPHFDVHESNRVGAVLHMSEMEGIKRLSDHDAVLCRQVAPLVDLAFNLIAKGRGCVILGKDIGAGLGNLIKKQNARGVDNLLEKLESFLETECAKFMAKGEEEKADSLTDRVGCIRNVIEHIDAKARTIPGLCAKLESMFSDSNGVLTLCSAHKAKGKEWQRVAILKPELMPSKWARQAWQYQQELNLQYVSWTRAIDELIFLDQPEPKKAA